MQSTPAKLLDIDNAKITDEERGFLQEIETVAKRFGTQREQYISVISKRLPLLMISRNLTSIEVSVFILILIHPLFVCHTLRFYILW